MATDIVERSILFTLDQYLTDKPTIALYQPGQPIAEKTKILQCFVSLMGDTAPNVAPLSASYTQEDPSTIYRFDWTFGLACYGDSTTWWDWQRDLRSEGAMCVQLLINSANSGIGITEITAGLLSLPPSRDTTSWFESHASQLGTLFTSLAAAGQGATLFAPTGVGALLQGSAALSNFVASSGEKGQKDWFIYRFLDPDPTVCQAVEWRIHRRLLTRYGPLLRGSITMTFHGSPRHDRPLSLQVRPQIGFYKDDELCFVAPTRLLSDDQQAQLIVRPQSTEYKGPQ